MSDRPKAAGTAAEIRRCVHCGFCTATCPTYVLLGDERDSPRGRIVLMKDLLSSQAAPSAQVVRHIDRCLSCLGCVTACPSGVDYRQLIDAARVAVDERYTRPWPDRLARALLAAVLPHRRRFALALRLAPVGRPFLPLIDRVSAFRPLAAMLRLATPPVRRRNDAPPVAVPADARCVALFTPCAEPDLRPEIAQATERLLARCGLRVVKVAGEGCCGALVHHLGKENAAQAAARRNVDAWEAAIARDGIEAIVVTASGCTSEIKRYGSLLAGDPVYATRAARIAAMVRDATEVIAPADLPRGPAPDLAVAWQAPCSLTHGQRIGDAGQRLLEAAGFSVRTPAEAHLCCGSAGTYNILQSEIAGQLGARKAAALAATGAQVVATSNIGCATQVAMHGALPVVHVIELLDWASGGPVPPVLAAHFAQTRAVSTRAVLPA
jgi:glycolate oxidase iron-sulfur subunit